MQVFRPSLALGRAFTTDEESRAEPAALLAHGFWRNRFSGDPKALGQTMVLGATSYVIIGVLAPSVGYPGDVDVWTPAPLELQNGSRAAGYLGIVARAQPGSSQTAAQSELNAMAQRLQAAYPETDAGLQGSLMPLREWIARDARTPGAIFRGGVRFADDLRQYRGLAAGAGW